MPFREVSHEENQIGICFCPARHTLLVAGCRQGMVWKPGIGLGTAKTAVYARYQVFPSQSIPKEMGSFGPFLTILEQRCLPNGVNPEAEGMKLGRGPDLSLF